MTQIIQNVSDTAFMVAGFRALETEREEPLFRDPLAAKLAGDHGRKFWPRCPRPSSAAWSVVIRTVIIDALIQRAVIEGVDTILNLGAGLDTRPYRMDLPRGLRFVEVDYPHVIELKETRLAEEEPRCRLERSRSRPHRSRRAKGLSRWNERRGGQDPRADRRRHAVFDRRPMSARSPTTSAGPRRFASGSPIIFRPRRSSSAQSCAGDSCATRRFNSRPRTGSASSLTHGWKASEVRYISEEADRLGRPIPLPLWLRLG